METLEAGRTEYDRMVNPARGTGGLNAVFNLETQTVNASLDYRKLHEEHDRRAVYGKSVSPVL